MKRFEEMYVSEQNPFFIFFGQKANFFRIFVRVFCSMVVKTAFCVSVGNLRGGFRFWGNVFFCFGEYRKLFRLFVVNFLTRLSKLLSTCSLEQFGDDLFKKNVQVFILSHFDRKSCTSMANFSWPSGYIVSAGLKLFSIYPQEPFEWVPFSRKEMLNF